MFRPERAEYDAKDAAIGPVQWGEWGPDTTDTFTEPVQIATWGLFTAVIYTERRWLEVTHHIADQHLDNPHGSFAIDVPSISAAKMTIAALMARQLARTVLYWVVTYEWRPELFGPYRAQEKPW